MDEPSVDEPVDGHDVDRDDVEEDADEGGQPVSHAASDERLRGLIGYILGQIVSKPDEIKIELGPDHKRMVYEVRVAADDVGVVIGRSGRTINAIRTLLRGVPDAPERVWVELIEEDEGRGRRRNRDARDDDAEGDGDGHPSDARDEAVAGRDEDDGDDRGGDRDDRGRDDDRSRDDRD